MKTRFLRYIAFPLLIVFGLITGGKALAQSITLTTITGGLTSTSTHLNSSMTQIPLFGFNIAVTGTIHFTKFVIQTGFTANAYLGNAKLYRNSGSTYPNSPQLVGTVTLGSSEIDINFSTAEVISNTNNNYFLVADIAYSGTSTIPYAPFKFDYNTTFGVATEGTYPAHNSDARAYVFDPPPPPTLAFTTNTTGYITGSTLYYGTTGIVLHAVTLTPTGNSYTIKSAKINYVTSKSGPQAFFPAANSQIWVSTTGSFATAAQITGASFGQSGNNITVSIGDFTISSGTSYTFYLVAGLTAGAASMPVTFAIDFAQIYSDYPAISYTNSSTQTSYTLSSGGVSTSDNNFTASGITSPTIAYGQTNIALFSFGLTVTGNMTITKMNIPSSIAVSPYLTNGKLYRSTDQYFTHASAVTATVNFTTQFNGAAISGLNEAFASTTPTTYYYFLVADFTPVGLGFASPASFNFSLPTSQTQPVIQNSSSNIYTATSLLTGQTFNVVSNYDWVSTSSTDFTAKGNFNAFNQGSAVTVLPNSGISVYIGRKTASASTPVLPDQTSIGSLTFSNAKLTNPTIALANGTITINGINVLSGTNATINGPATGTATLLLPAGSLSTLTSTSTLTLGNNVTLSIASTAILDIKSDASGTGAIGTIPSSSNISGNVYVERWITGGTASAYRGYRLLSSPVNISNSTTGNIDLGYLNNNSNTAGALTGGPGGTTKGFSATSNTPAIYLYREDFVPVSGTNGGKNKGVMSIYSTGTSSNVDVATGSTTLTTTNFQIPVGNGFLFYNIGSTAQPNNTASNSTPASYAITAKGTLNQGTITFKNWYTGASTLSYTSSLASNQGFNMLGNPYACSLDLNSFYGDNSTVIQPNIYSLKDASQSYISYNAFTGAKSDPSASSRYVASGQGMIVQAKSASALTFKESQKAATQQLTGSSLLMGIPANEPTLAGFYMKMEKDSLTNDYCGIYFDGSSDNFDSDDAIDLDGNSPKVYMSSYTADGQRTGINSLSDYKNGKAVKLYVNATTDGLYKLKIEQIKNIDAIYDIWLKDNYKNDSLDLRTNDTYNFNIIRSDAASLGADRFQVIIKRKALPAYQFVSLTAQSTPSGININWKTQNEYDFTGFTVEKLGANKLYNPIYSAQSDGSGIYSFLDKNPTTGINTYRIKQSDIDNKISYSTSVSVNPDADAKNNNFIVYPSSATSQVNIKFTNPLATPTNVVIVSVSGDVVNKQLFTQQQGIIDVSRLKTGIYFIQATNANTQQKIGLQRFIKL